MDGTMNNSKEVGTILSQIVKIEPGLGNSSNESSKDEVVVTRLCVNAEMTVFSIPGNTALEFEIAATEELGFEVKIEAPEESLAGCQSNETEAVSNGANCERTTVNLKENSVGKFASNVSNSKQVGAFPEKKSAASKLSSDTNSRAEVDTVLSKVVKIEPVPEEQLIGSWTGEAVTSHCMNCVFGGKKKAIPEFQLNVNGSEEVGTVLLEVAKRKSVFRELSKSTSKNGTGRVMYSKAGEITDFEESGLLTFLDVGVKREDGDNSEESQESAQSSNGSALCEMQEPVHNRQIIQKRNDCDGCQVSLKNVARSVSLNNREDEENSEECQEPVQNSCGSAISEMQEPLLDHQIIQEVNDFDGLQCSNDVAQLVSLNADQIFSEMDKNPRNGSGMHLKSQQDSDSIKLRNVEVKLKDLFPIHVRKLGLAHSNIGSCACIYCHGDYRHSSESQQVTKGLKNQKRPKRSQNFCKVDGNKKYQRGYYGETFRKVQNKRIFQCDKCSQKFKNRSDLNTHFLVHGNPYKCKYCPQRFAMMSSYYAHLELHVNKRFKCEQCAANFWHRSTFEEHLRVHSKEKPFKCKLCSTKFSRNSTLQTHMRTHTDSRPFKCPQCAASFKYNSNLTVHLRLHSGEKPFKCNQCSAEFLTSTNLKGHLRRHSGEKPYKCKQCHARFSKSSTLKTHLTVHSNEKAYQCKLCPERYKVQFGLRKHVIKVHKGATKFVCKLCPERFVDKRTFNNHQERHINNDRYACAHCSATFVLKPHLTHHLKMVH